MSKKKFIIFLLGYLMLGSAQVFSENYTPVTVPNGHTLDYKLVNGVKEFHLTVEEIEHEFAPGMKSKCWGYNGTTPGPVIEVVEGDQIRVLVTNKLKENTAVHWHGVFLANGMDGVTGLTQKGIEPGETFAYKFTLRQHGTFMYHSHGDEMIQMGLGTMGFLIVHPKVEKLKIDRDFAIFVNEWFVPVGIGMGGMFSILKVRDAGHLKDTWYTHPEGTVAKAIQTQDLTQKIYTCVMHPEIQKDSPGVCPKCGMTLVHH